MRSRGRITSSSATIQVRESCHENGTPRLKISNPATDPTASIQRPSRAATASVQSRRPWSDVSVDAKARQVDQSIDDCCNSDYRRNEASASRNDGESGDHRKDDERGRHHRIEGIDGPPEHEPGKHGGDRHDSDDEMASFERALSTYEAEDKKPAREYAAEP